ncbi:putative enzyme [Klebsiella pneumoniae]|nr:putative enzyme [Klebsiella pneumoniae]
MPRPTGATLWPPPGQCRWNSPRRGWLSWWKSTWTREIIERNGTFGIVVPGVAAASWTYAVGSVSGRDEDKFNAWGIPVVTGPELGLPLIEEKCLAWMECRLLPATAAQTQYDTLFGEVVSAAADERVRHRTLAIRRR